MENKHDLFIFVVLY